MFLLSSRSFSLCSFVDPSMFPSVLVFFESEDLSLYRIMGENAISGNLKNLTIDTKNSSKIDFILFPLSLSLSLAIESPKRGNNRSNGYGDDGSDDDEIAAARNESLKVEETKMKKPKKEKKPKVSLPEAASKIDPSNLEAFLVEATDSYATQPEIQLMRFADYFGRALSGVSSVQFPWVKMFKESPLSKLIDV